MNKVTARYVDTCLSDYLLDGCNRPGQALGLASLGFDRKETARELSSSVLSGDFGIPDLVECGDVIQAFYDALEGVDLRYIDGDGNPQDERPEEDPGDEEPYLYVVLEWKPCEHDPVWASAAAADSCDGIIDITCSECGASGSVQINESDINW